MSLLVVDASVVVKWCLPDRPDEQDADKALAIMEAFVQGDLRLLQPAHWLAEAAAVLARLDPERAQEMVALLHDLEIHEHTSPEVWCCAVKLACDLRHHLFDTLYHALALEHPGGLLVTADDAYFTKARSQGSIVRLCDFASHESGGHI